MKTKLRVAIRSKIMDNTTGSYYLELNAGNELEEMLDDIMRVLDESCIKEERKTITLFRTWWWGNRESATDITNNDLDRYFEEDNPNLA